VIVEILTFGDELLDGRRIDSNSGWLGRRLTSLGVPPRFHQTVADTMEDSVAALRLALSRSDFVLCTGGLGPTQDDLTFEAVAQAFGQKLTLRPEVWERVRGIFESRGVPCPESNRRQALLPEMAKVLDNLIGTAPGCSLEIGQRILFCLPGVPVEMTELFELYVAPELRKRLGEKRRLEKVYKFVGLGESLLEERLEKAGLRQDGKADLRVAYTASFPQIDVTLSSIDDSTLQKADRLVRRELEEFLVAIDAETLEANVLEICRKRKLTLAVAESITGGQIGSLLVGVPGSSDVLDRGFVTYSNRSKVELLGVKSETLERHGAVSEECAMEMARGAKEKARVDVAVAVTGIAGPAGGSPEKPVGLTYVAWVGPDFEEVRRYQFRWERNRNRMLAAYEALKGLKALLSAPQTK